MKQFKEYTSGRRQLIPPNPDELISESDLVRVVERVLNKVDKSLLLSPFKSHKGQPPYHPCDDDETADLRLRASYILLP